MVLIPKSPRVLIDQLQAAGGELRVSEPVESVRAAWRRLIHATLDSGAIPDGQRLRHTGRNHGDLIVRLVAADESTREVPEPLPIPDRLTRPHPLIAATKTAATSNRSEGWIDTRAVPGVLHLDIASGSLTRVLRLAQALVDQSLRRGHTVDVLTQHGCPGLAIFVQGHGYELFFVEENDRVAHAPRRYELAKVKRNPWARIPEWDYIPSGRVQLKLGHDSYDKRLTGDRKRWKLEDRLAQALGEIEELAAEAEERRLETERKAAERQREWEEALARREERFREAKRAEHLSEQIARWRLTSDIRAVIAQLRIAAMENRDAIDEAWLDWAEQYAANIDPTNEPMTFPPDTEPSPEALTPYLDGWSPYGPQRSPRY